jgi:hypothetical protein
LKELKAGSAYISEFHVMDPKRKPEAQSPRKADLKL